MIEDVLQFGGERHLFAQGSWMSVVDAHIVNGIENGLAENLGMRHDGAEGSGFKEWDAFFEARRTLTATDEESIRLWGIAEQTATDFGNGEALRAGLRPRNAGESATGLGAGNLWRAALQNQEAAKLLAARGGAGVGSVLGPLGTVGGGVAGYAAADWFFDPRTEGGVYHTAVGIYESLRAPLPWTPVVDGANWLIFEVGAAING